jgi:hypothetical protein
VPDVNTPAPEDTGLAAPPYRAENGRFLTEALFWETSRDRVKYPPVFTLKDHDHEGCRSMKAEYLRVADPTEYEFALEVLGSFSHWKTLASLVWFQPHLAEWRDELDLSLRAAGARSAREILNSKTASEAARLQAAKFLTEKGYNKKATKGRPRKEDVSRAAREMAETGGWVDEDHARIIGGTH